MIKFCFIFNFLNAFIKRVNNNKLETRVYQKPTSSNVNIKWNAHAPTEWKTETLRNAFERPKLICSDEGLVKEEKKYLTKIFYEVNDYRMYLINTTAQQQPNDSPGKNRRAEANKTSNKTQLIFPYSGKQGKKLITKMKKHIRKTLPENRQAIVTYQSKKSSTNFNVKDKTEFYHQSNLAHYGKCPNQTCTENYIGETDCRSRKE